VYSADQLLTLVIGLSASELQLVLVVLCLVLQRKAGSGYWLFGIISFTMAWYCAWVGIVHSGVIDHAPRLMGGSQLVTGYFGPALYLFTRSVTESEQPKRHYYLLFLIGCVPTLGSLSVVAMGNDAASQILEAYQNQQLSDYPFYYYFFVLHTLSVATFVLLSLFHLLVALSRGIRAELRYQTWFALIAILEGFAALALSNLLPVVGIETAPYAPLAMLPVAATLYLSLDQNRRTMSEMDHQRRSMGRYLPQEVTKSILDGRHSFALGGQEATVTVLFCDIRDFTQLSEKLSPAEVVCFLNRFFTAMNHVIFRHYGMVDKFIGDAILAAFGVTTTDSTTTENSDAANAVACAREMMEVLREFNIQWVKEGHRPIAIGIALHRGHVVHGNVGSDTRMDYTIIGDTVNTASRVSGLNKELGAPLLATGQVVEQLPESARSNIVFVEERTMRGRSFPTALYKVEFEANRP
jgi:class 3 adenylate cyclase